MKNIHFISGLPRSGSTLLAAILNQNPNFRAGMTSPLYGIFAAALRHMSSHNEASMFISDRQRHNILDGIVSSFYGDDVFDDSKTIFDTSRAWTTKCNILFDLFPDARMICCVRNLSWIIDSFERILRQNKFQPSKMFGCNPHQNIYQRANQLTGPEGIIGTSYNNLREAFFGPHSDRLMLIEYESLCRVPEFVIASIYNFTGIDCHMHHDFANVSYSADEFDERLGTPGLHTVRRKVEPFKERVTLLPPDIFEAHAGQDFWNNDQARARSNAIVL